MEKYSKSLAPLPFIIATVGEFIALAGWMYFLIQDEFWLANILLWFGFLIKRYAVIGWLSKLSPDGVFAQMGQVKKLLGVVAVTLPEIIIWIVWWAVFAYTDNHLIAFVTLMVMMQFEHSVELGFATKPSWKKFLLDYKTVFFTLCESLGASIWLYFVVEHGHWVLGSVCLLLGLGLNMSFRVVSLPITRDNFCGSIESYTYSNIMRGLHE